MRPPLLSKTSTINIPHLLKLSDRLLSAYERAMSAQNGVKRVSMSKLKQTLISTLEQDDGHGDQKHMEADFVSKVFGEKSLEDSKPADFAAKRKRKFLLDLATRAMQKRVEMAEDKRDDKIVEYYSDVKPNADVAAAKSEKYVPVAIRHMEKENKDILETDKTSTTTHTAKSTPQAPLPGDLPNFKIFNRREPPLKRVTTTATTSTTTTARTTTTTTKTTTVPTTIIATTSRTEEATTKKSARWYQNTPNVINSPTPPNYKVTFVNGARRPQHGQIKFSDLPMKKGANEKRTSHMGSKSHQLAKVKVQLPSKHKSDFPHAKNPESQHPGQSSPHLGQKQIKPEGNKDQPHLVSPFLMSKPISPTDQFHYRRHSSVASPSSIKGDSVTNSFLESSPFMETSSSSTIISKGGEGAYLKVKVIESPFLLDLETDKEGTVKRHYLFVIVVKEKSFRYFVGDESTDSARCDTIEQSPT